MSDGSKEINTFLDQIIGYVNGLCFSEQDDMSKKVLRHLAMNMHSVKAYIAKLEDQVGNPQAEAPSINQLRAAANLSSVEKPESD